MGLRLAVCIMLRFTYYYDHCTLVYVLVLEVEFVLVIQDGLRGAPAAMY